jgi:phage-related protein
MPTTAVVLFAEANGEVPLLAWMDQLPPKVQAKLISRLDLLREKGHELRRPHADTLRDGVHELRASRQRVNYRMLYFFHGQMAVISHGITKEDVIPPKEIELAGRRKEQFEADPEKHTYREG